MELLWEFSELVHVKCLAWCLSQYILAVIITIIIIISTFMLSVSIFIWATFHILAIIY